MQLADDFREVLSDVDLDRLDRTQNTAFALRPDLTVAYANDAWERFALANDGPEVASIGTRMSAIDAIAPPLQTFYRRLFKRVIHRAKPTDHEYYCPSPNASRRIHMHLTPLPGGVLTVHHLVAEASPAPFIGPDGFAIQCCHCRATQRVDAPDTWDWVPALLDRERHDVSHGLCPVCFSTHHPEAARRRREWQNRQHDDPSPTGRR